MIHLLTANFGYKLLALSISVAFWLVIVDTPESTTFVSVPVQYRNIPKDLEIASGVADQVHLELHGPAGKLTSHSLAETVVSLDLRQVTRPGDRTFSISSSNAILPSGVQLERAVPAQVRLHFERRETREVPVTLRIGTPPPAGYEIASRKVEPATLKIVGPESRVRGVAAVETDPVDLSAIAGPETHLVHAYVADPQVRFEGNARVAVTIRLKPAKPDGN